jgi:hypothetical protein
MKFSEVTHQQFIKAVNRDTDKLVIDGLDKLAKRLPNDNWWEIRIRVRRIPTGCEAWIDRDMTECEPPQGAQ